MQSRRNAPGAILQSIAETEESTKRTTSRERLSIIYRIHSIRDEIQKQSTTFVRRLERTKEKGKSDKLRRHAERSLTAIREIGRDIVCGREMLNKNETWKNQLERRYDERREAEGSNSATTRKPNICAKWKDEEWVMTDAVMDARRRSTVARWFIHRFPISQKKNAEQDCKLKELR